MPVGTAVIVFVAHSHYRRAEHGSSSDLFCNFDIIVIKHVFKRNGAIRKLRIIVNGQIGVGISAVFTLFVVVPESD